MHKIANRIAAALLVCLLAPYGCGEDRDDGTTCAGCGEANDAACGTWIVPDDDIELFCGDVPLDQCFCMQEADDGTIVCQVTLACGSPRDSAARLCYPLQTDGRFHPDFTCDGVRPEPGFPATPTPIPTPSPIPSPTPTLTPVASPTPQPTLPPA